MSLVRLVYSPLHDLIKLVGGFVTSQLDQLVSSLVVKMDPPRWFVIMLKRQRPSTELRVRISHPPSTFCSFYSLYLLIWMLRVNCTLQNLPRQPHHGDTNQPLQFMTCEGHVTTELDTFWGSHFTLNVWFWFFLRSISPFYTAINNLPRRYGQLSKMGTRSDLARN